MEIILNTPEKLVIRMPANEPLANSIRRSVSEVPTLAIEDVEIYKNDSALYDENLALRLGLIPIKTEKSMNSKTAIEFKLSKEGPCTVYASDLKGDGDIIYPKMPLTILGDENKLELVATAVLGKGTTHAKFIPGLCYYRRLIEVNSFPEADKIIEKSKSLIKPEKKGAKWFCDLNESEVDAINEKKKDSVSDSEEILFVIESYGNMPAKDIMSKAIEALTENLDEFEKAMK